MQPIVTFEQSVNVAHCLVMHVNGIETNTHHYTPENKYYNFTCNDTERAAQHLRIAELIREGVITADKWEMWDICAWNKFQVDELHIIPQDAPDPHWNNTAVTRTGNLYGEDPKLQAQAIKEITGSILDTQLTKRWVNNNISNKVGIKFYNYGYSVYFI